MKKILYILLIIIFADSCSFHKLYVDSQFEQEMYDFYQNHLRYPRSSRDYCESFYKCDSLNNYKFACQLLNSSNLNFKTLDEYNHSLDSAYLYYRDHKMGLIPYFSWIGFYKNLSDNDMKYKHGKVLIKKKLDNCTYYANDMMKIVNNWIYNKKPFDKYDTYPPELDRMAREFVCFRMCTKDSILINYPKNIFNKYKAYKDVYEMVDSVTMPIQKRMQHKDIVKYEIRYHRNGKIESIDKRRKLPQEIVNCKPLHHYMDSCINIDNRVEFVQFYYIKRIKIKQFK